MRSGLGMCLSAPHFNPSWHFVFFLVHLIDQLLFASSLFCSMSKPCNHRQKINTQSTGQNSTDMFSRHSQLKSERIHMLCARGEEGIGVSTRGTKKIGNMERCRVRAKIEERKGDLIFLTGWVRRHFSSLARRPSLGVFSVYEVLTKVIFLWWTCFEFYTQPVYMMGLAVNMMRLWTLKFSPLRFCGSLGCSRYSPCLATSDISAPKTPDLVLVVAFISQQGELRIDACEDLWWK